MPIVTRISLLVQESLRPLRSILLGLTPLRALIIDIFATDAFHVSRELSIPVYSFFTASTVLFALSLYLPTLDCEVEGEFVDLPEPIQVPGCNPIRTEDLLDQVRDRKIDEYKWYLLHVSRLTMAAGILVNTWEDLEPVWLRAIKQEPFFHSIPTPPVHAIGPLIKEEEPVMESHAIVLPWLDKQPCGSVLYVALGSGGTMKSEQLIELAWGLEMSQQRFILVARKPTEVNGFATFFNVGSDVNDPMSYLPDGFTERTKGLGLVVPSWAPQEVILRHAAIGGFLSHCGWNSTLESVVHGVPMIAWPLYAEQRMNATMLTEEVGVAMKLAVGDAGRVVGREEIQRVVRLVMEGEEGKKMRSKARELQLSAKEALSHGGSSYESLARIAHSWKLDCHKNEFDT